MTQFEPTTEFRVVKGEPTAEELAAIVVVLRSQAQDEVNEKKLAPEWNAPHRNVRWHFEYGTAMWRRSALPH